MYFINFIHTIKFEFIIIVIIAKTEYLPVLSDSPLSSNNLLSCMKCLILYTWITGALSILCFNLTKIVFPHLKKRKNANVRTTNGKPKIRSITT